MATTYKATVSIEVQKQHRCVGCSALFRYPMKRSSTAQAATADLAEKQARDALGKLLVTSFDLHACPTCGIYQPEMVHKLRRDVTGFLTFLVNVAPLILAGLGFFEVVPWHIAA